MRHFYVVDREYCNNSSPGSQWRMKVKEKNKRIIGGYPSAADGDIVLVKTMKMRSTAL